MPSLLKGPGLKYINLNTRGHIQPNYRLCSKFGLITGPRRTIQWDRKHGISVRKKPHSEPRAVQIRLLLEYIPDAPNIKDLDPRLLTASPTKSLPSGSPMAERILREQSLSTLVIRDADGLNGNWNKVIGFEADVPNFVSLIQISKTLEDCIPPRHRICI